MKPAYARSGSGVADRDDTEGTMLDHALAYARADIPIFPVNAHKEPMMTTHGFYDATTDEEQIRSWWTLSPDAGIAAPTGTVSGVVVLDGDIDPEMGKNGEIEIERLQKEYGDLPTGPRSKTGRGGSHRFFAHSGIPVPCSTNGLAWGVDVKADGGYAVLPPSPHYKGTQYCWIVPLLGTPLPPIPEWLLKKMLGTGEERPPIHTRKIIKAGTREDTLFRIGCSLRANGKAAEQILESLREVNQRRCKPPLGDDEVQHAAEMAARYPPGTGDSRFTDLGNGRLLVQREKGEVLYVHDIGKWFIWSGTRWAEDRDGEIERRAKATVESLHEEAKAIMDDEQRKAMRQHALKSESASRIRSMLELARSEPEVAATSEIFDADALLLNTKNGTLNLQTGELQEHRREDLIMRTVPVAYDPDAECPRWKRFLDRIMGKNKNLLAFLRRAVGCTLTGIQVQSLFMLYGGGANGKSTFLAVIKALLGDYAKNCQPDTLTTSRGNGIDNDLARLRGARLVTSIESDEGRRLAEAKIKQITGGDAVTARFLFHEHFEFVPVFKLWLATNHKPEIRGGDEAIWRRLLLIPFQVQIPEAERDADLPEKLKEELPGILAWAVRGCWAWKTGGLKPPAEVLVATAAYRTEEDRVSAFIDQRCETGPKEEQPAGELYRAYKNWALENGEEPLTSTAFGRRLEEKSFGMKRGGKGRVRLGLSLKDTCPDMETV